MIKIKKTAALILIIFLISSAFYISHEKSVIKLQLENNKPSILFLENCKYDSFSIKDGQGKEISSVLYSINPGEGVDFKENTYIPMEKFFKIAFSKNKIYKINATTECLTHRQIPTITITFIVNKTGEINTLKTE